MTLTRRDFVKRAAVAGMTMLAPVTETTAADPFGGFKMGAQSYCFRNFAVEQAIQKVAELGLHYIEIYPEHFPHTSGPEKRKALKRLLKDNGVTLFSYGVVGFRDADKPFRPIFDFAKDMGLVTLSSDIGLNNFDELDKLVDEYKINLGIHNHWFEQKYEYERINDVLKAITGHNKRIGATIDTGHYLSFNEDPVVAIEKLNPRIYSVHLKDTTVDKPGVSTVLGSGRLGRDGTLRVLNQLRRIRYSNIVALEYEEDPQDPMPALRRCLDVVKAAVARVGSLNY